MNFVVNTGDQRRDQEELTRYQQHYRQQGLELYAQALPTGGYQVTIAPPAPAAPPPPQPYGAAQCGGQPPPGQYYGGQRAPAHHDGGRQPPAQQYGAQQPPAQYYG